MLQRCKFDLARLASLRECLGYVGMIEHFCAVRIRRQCVCRDAWHTDLERC